MGTGAPTAHIVGMPTLEIGAASGVVDTLLGAVLVGALTTAVSRGLESASAHRVAGRICSTGSATYEKSGVLRITAGNTVNCGVKLVIFVGSILLGLGTNGETRVRTLSEATRQVIGRRVAGNGTEMTQGQASSYSEECAAQNATHLIYPTALVMPNGTVGCATRLGGAVDLARSVRYSKGYVKKGDKIGDATCARETNGDGELEVCAILTEAGVRGLGQVDSTGKAFGGRIWDIYLAHEDAMKLIPTAVKYEGQEKLLTAATVMRVADGSWETRFETRVTVLDGKALVGSVLIAVATILSALIYVSAYTNSRKARSMGIRPLHSVIDALNIAKAECGAKEECSGLVEDVTIGIYKTAKGDEHLGVITPDVCPVVPHGPVKDSRSAV